MEDLVLNIEKKVSDFISLYSSLKNEKQEIIRERTHFAKEIEKKEMEICDLKEKINLLRITKSVNTHEFEQNKESRKKINEYVREIDKCIALLNK